MGWATGFFIPCLGEGQQKTVSTETDFAPPPVLYDQSLSRKQRPVFLEAGIVDNILLWDVLKNIQQIKSYNGTLQALRALTVHKTLKIRILLKKFFKMKAFLVVFQML